MAADGRILIDTKIDTKGVISGEDEIIRASRRMAKDVEHLSDSVRASFSRQADALQKSSRLYVDQAVKVEILKQKLEALRSEKIPTDEYKSLQSEIYKNEKALDKLIEKQIRFVNTGGNIKSKTFERMEYDIEQTRQKLEELKKAKEKMEASGGAYISKANTQQIVDMESKITTEMQRQQEMNRSLETSYNRLSAMVSKYSDEISRAATETDNFSRVENETGQSMQSAQGYVGGLRASLYGLNTVLTRSLPVSLTGVKAGLSGLLSGLKAIAKASAKAALAMAQMAGRGIVGGLKKITSGIFSLNKSANKSTSGFNLSLKTLLKYGIGIESLFTLINKLRSAIQDGMKNLAQYSNSTNATLSGLMSSLEQCKNALATAFDPILQAVAPALNYLISLVTAATTAVAQLIAALTGKSTFVKAVKVQKNYASALKGTGSAAKEAGEEAEGSLASFDKLNVMADENANKGGGGGGGGGGGAGDMFETVPVESQFKNIADQLKNFIHSQDWEGLGAYIANGLNNGLQELYNVINWDNVGPRITYFVNAFTDTFNSLVDNLDWDLLGRTIGAGINTVVNTLNLLIEGIDWENLGTKLSVGFRGMLNEVDWKNLGNLIGNKFMISWNLFKGFVDDMWRTNNFTGLSGWNELGISLGEGLNGIFEKIDLGKIGATLGSAITGAFRTAIDFAKTFDWKALGDNISNGINKFFQEFDGKTTAQGATKVISGILDTLIETISTTDWAAIWRDIIDFLVNVNWLELIGKLGIAAVELIAGLVKGLVEAIQETDWGAVWDSIVQAFKDFFGIHSPSTLMEEQGGFLMDGLKEGIANFIPNVIEKFGELKDKIIDKWDEVKQNTSEKWDDIKTDLSEKIDNIKENANTKLGELKDKVTEIWNNTKEDSRSKWEDIKGNLVNVWNELKKSAEEKFRDIERAVQKTWEKIQSFGGGVGGSVFGAGLDFAMGSSYSRAATPASQPILPKLASGTVVPPRAGEFAAILGDNNRETEVVSPLSTMKQAVLEAMQQAGAIGGGDINVTINLDGRVVYQDIIKRNRQEKSRTGMNPLLV